MRAATRRRPFTSLGEVGQVLRRTATCRTWNPWDTTDHHQQHTTSTVKEPNGGLG
jgi:hypothetical protein